MENSSFDEIIKAKLQHAASPAPDQRAWDLFMLSAIEKGAGDLFEDPSAEIDHLASDEYIKNALNNIKVEYNEKNWEAISSQLDAEQKEEDPALVNRFDQSISRSLKGVTRKYDATTWPKLAARIEAEEKYLSHYYRAKFVEAIVFLFLIITLFQWNEWRTSGIHHESRDASKVEVAQEIRNSTQNTDLASGYASGPAMESSKNALNHIIQSNAQLLSRIRNRAALYMQKPVLHDDPSMRNEAGIALTTPVIDKVIEDSHTSDLAHMTLATLSSDKINPEGDLSSTHPIDRVQSLDRLLDRQKFTTDPRFNHPAYSNEEMIRAIDESYYKNTLKAKKNFNIGTWRVSGYSHFDGIKVSLPEQKINLYGEFTYLEQKKVYSQGYGVGFKALFSKNRFGIEFGAGYASRSYSPERYSNSLQYGVVYFKNVNYDILEIPVSIRFNSKSLNRLRPYAQLGMNGNIITKASYDVILPPVKSSSFSSSINTRSITEVQKNYEEEFARYDRRRALIYAQGSVGLEWKATQTVDLYSQISYLQRMFLEKYGPNIDQFRMLSVEIGLRSKL